MASAEIEEGPRVLGIGVGLFLLILLWSFTLLIILVFTRVSSASGILLTSFSLIVSAILLGIPRHPPAFKDRITSGPDDDEEESLDFKIYDNIMIWKIIFVIIMVIFTLGGTIAFCCSHVMYQNYAQPIKKIKL